jgi:hypothetical protein
MKTKRKRHLLGLAVAVCALAATGADRPPEIVRYYDQWIGCKAPPIQFDQSDRTQYAESSYRGKRVLLYSFDAGNFCDAPNMPALLKGLTALHESRSAVTEPLHVIGYTRGTMWSPCLAELTTNQIPREIDEVSHFPVVNLNNKRDEGALGEPYELLKCGPSAILIGTNGLICKIFPHPMTEVDFKVAVSASPWTAEMKEPPEETSKQVWDKTPKKDVIVARRDIASGTVLAHRYVVVDTVAESVLPKSFFRPDGFSNLVGRVLLHEAREGQPLTPDMIGETIGVPTSQRTVP